MAKVYPLPKLYHPDFALPGVKPVGPVEIDWDNPITEGLIESLLYQNRLDSEFGMAATGGTGQVKANALDLNGSSELVEYTDAETNDKFDDLGEITIVADIHVNSLTADQYIFMKGDDFYPSIVLFIDDSGPNGTDVVDMFIGRNGASGHERSSPSVSITTGRHTVIGTFDGSRSQGDKCFSYVDGVDVSQNSSAGSEIFEAVANTGKLRVGGRYDNNLYFDGKIYSINVFNRVLSQAEIQSLSDNPYQIYRPAIPMSYFVPAAAAGGGNEPLFYHHQRMLSRCS